MKKLLTLCLLMAAAFTLQAQTLSGVQDYSGNRGGYYYYTKVNWRVNYSFVMKGEQVFIRLSNPSIFASPASLFGDGNESYSKSDLGLSRWPDSEPTTANFRIVMNVSYPDGSSHKLTPYVKEDTYVASISKFKNASLSSFRVTSVESMGYNGGADDVVYRLILAKKNGNTAATKTAANTSNNNTENSETESEKHILKPSDIGIPDDNANTTSGNSNPMTKYNPNTSSGSTALDNLNKGLDQGQEIVNIATGIVDLFAPTQAQLQRRDEEDRKRQEEIRKTEIKQKQANIDQVRRAELYERSFKRDIEEYIDGANNGDMIMKMKLLCEKAMNERRGEIDLSHLLPDWKQWLIDAANKNYFDAINLIGIYSLYYHPSPLDFTLEEGVNMLKKSADLGNVESMIILANYYDQEKDCVKALYWYKAAAKKNSQYAMYSLGNIYRYNNATKLSSGVKYNITNNDTALIYFKKASNSPPLLESFFYKNFGYVITENGSDHTTTDAYRELSIMYRDGLGCEKDNTKAEEYKKLSHYPIGVTFIYSDAFTNFIKGEYSACMQKLDEVDSLLGKNNKTTYLRICCLDQMSKNGNIENLGKLRILTDSFIQQYEAMDKDEEYNKVYEIAQRINYIDPKQVYTTAEVMPEFAGGQAGLTNHIVTNIKFPTNAINNNISGRVYISFVVDTKGSVKNITVIKGLGKEFDEEAVRVVRIMPSWTPGYQNGKPVNVQFTMPFKFTANHTEEKPANLFDNSEH